MNLFKREPALIIGAVQAVIVVAVAFGLNLTPEQTGGILTALAAILAVVTRASVVSPATNHRAVKAAARLGTSDPGQARER